MGFLSANSETQNSVPHVSFALLQICWKIVASHFQRSQLEFTGLDQARPPVVNLKLSARPKARRTFPTFQTDRCRASGRQ